MLKKGDHILKNRWDCFDSSIFFPPYLFILSFYSRRFYYSDGNRWGRKPIRNWTTQIIWERGRNKSEIWNIALLSSDRPLPLFHAHPYSSLSLFISPFYYLSITLMWRAIRYDLSLPCQKQSSQHQFVTLAGGQNVVSNLLSKRSAGKIIIYNSIS